MYNITGPKGHHWVLTKGDLLLLGTLAIWELVWRGFALWHAGRNRQKGWFIAMLIINSVGILEIIYLAFFQQKPSKQR